ncbi:MAG: hypothetical protein ACREKS_15570, partial [Candidatus Rokuibacteriota bacterium]
LGKRSFFPEGWIERLLEQRIINSPSFPRKDKNEDSGPRPGRWFHAGTDRTVKMLAKVGYTIVERDVGLVHRDPIIHFRKLA